MAAPCTDTSTLYADYTSCLWDKNINSSER